MLLKDIVLPIQSSNYEEGCGFFLESYFVTSGHVVNNAEDPSIYISGKSIELLNPIFCGTFDDGSEGYDLAVYQLPDSIHGLDLYDGDIKAGMELVSISYKMIQSGYDFIESKATVGDIREGNYFSAVTDRNLKPGCSGSPALMENKVVGIMTAGNNNGSDVPVDSKMPLNFCVFLSSEAIRRILNSIKGKTI